MITTKEAQGQARHDGHDSTSTEAEYAETLNRLAESIHRDNEKWWCDLKTGARLDRNVGEMLCLVHSEISEAMEGHRKGLRDDHLPHRSMIEVELADAVIRILDICAGLNLDIGTSLMEKLAYNRVRADHKVENRIKEGGKKF